MALLQKGHPSNAKSTKAMFPLKSILGVVSAACIFAWTQKSGHSQTITGEIMNKGCQTLAHSLLGSNPAQNTEALPEGMMSGTQQAKSIRLPKGMTTAAR